MAGQNRESVDFLLAQSLKELAESRSIEKITIKEITDRAGVIRPTFYNHFQDKYELLEWIIETELLEPIKPLLQNDMVPQALALLFTGIEKDRKFYLKVCYLEGQNSFESIIKECARDMLMEVLTQKGKQIPYPWLSQEIIAEYHAQSLGFLVLKWLKTGMNISIQEMVDTYDYMLRNSIEDILQR